MAVSFWDKRSATAPSPSDGGYRRALRIALAVNLAMFGVEITATLLSGSVSIQADALEFLGDAANYAVALVVCDMVVVWRARAAMLKGVILCVFGLVVAASAIWHAMVGTLPDAGIMSVIGLVAFTANVTVAMLLFRHRKNDSQALSVWLCARNDSIANVAVI